MTYPPQQPPVNPGYPPQQTYQQPAWQPAPVPPPVDRKQQNRRSLIIAGSVTAGVAVLSAIALLTSPHQKATPASERFTITITSCTATDVTAAVGFTVTNKTSTAASAFVDIEYRDGSGARLDTDTSWVRNIAPGDTVRTEESTFLDAPPNGSMTCRITGIH